MIRDAMELITKRRVKANSFRAERHEDVPYEAEVT